MNYKRTHRAENDLINIYRFGVQNSGVRQAESYDEDLYRIFELLCEKPLLNIERARLRKIRIHFHASHAIIYRIRDDDVVIVRVLHASQDWRRHL